MPPRADPPLRHLTHALNTHPGTPTPLHVHPPRRRAAARSPSKSSSCLTIAFGEHQSFRGHCELSVQEKPTNPKDNSVIVTPIAQTTPQSYKQHQKQRTTAGTRSNTRSRAKSSGQRQKPGATPGAEAAGECLRLLLLQIRDEPLYSASQCLHLIHIPGTVIFINDR